MDKAKDAEAQLKEILRSYNPTSPWLYGPSTRLKAWVMMLFIPRAAAPLKGLRIVANISLLSCLITKDRLKTQPHKQTQTPYLMPDPYIPSLPSILLGCLRSNSSTTWKKPSSSSSPLWWASSCGPSFRKWHCYTHSFQKCGHPLWPPPLSDLRCSVVHQILQLHPLIYNRTATPLAGCQDVPPGSLYQSPN